MHDRTVLSTKGEVWAIYIGFSVFFRLISLINDYLFNYRYRKVIEDYITRGILGRKLGRMKEGRKGIVESVLLKGLKEEKKGEGRHKRNSYRSPAALRSSNDATTSLPSLPSSSLHRLPAVVACASASAPTDLQLGGPNSRQ